MSKPRHLVLAKRLAHDGHGIAFEGEEPLEFWVPDLLPGETAWVEIEHKSPHKPRAWAKLIERASAPSDQRVAPHCPAHGICGGCAWQHLCQEGQLEEKRLRVQGALDAALGESPRVPTPQASKACGYRNKGKYVVAQSDDGVVLGAYKPRSHQVVSTLGCQIVEPAIDEVAVAVAEAATALSSPVYQEGAEDSDGLRYVIIRANRDAQVLVLLICTGETPAESMQALADSLLQNSPVVGVLRCDNDLRTGALLTEAITPLAGATALAETVAGVSIALGPAAFWQLNREQAERAYTGLAEGLGLEAGARVTELYCGVGAISFALARSGYRVVGVEKDPAAVAIAKESARAAGLESLLSFECGDATNLAPKHFEGADAIVVDPPRKGLGERGRKQLLNANPERIAYLSCGPESLAQDLAVLVKAGYQIENLQLYDFMPGTSQVETLVHLRRSES